MQVCGAPSSHLWEDQDGVVHTITQAEGGEQGDPLMPAWIRFFHCVFVVFELFYFFSFFLFFFSVSQKFSPF